MAAVPTTFGKYFLTEKIATGGMAEIYLAKLIGPGGFEKQLIIKQIHPELSDRQQFVELFVDEAKTLVSLSHGNIVPIYELGVVDDTYFIAMEYIDGPSLDRLLRELRAGGKLMDPAVAGYITAELLKGLNYAHRKGDGVIHRDLSPRNVMVSREGEVKLVDFGLAVTVDGRQLSAGKGGRPVGSFPYMSPEQVRREPLDGQSDLFSAATLLWEMLAGRMLFGRPTEDQTLEAVLELEIPKPSKVRPSVPAQLDEICLRALARDKSERYASAGQFLAAINRYVYSVGVTAEAVAELVKATCPPVAAAIAKPVPESEPEPGSDPHSAVAADHTRPMEGRSPHGKRRAETVQTFATNVEFEEVLAKHTPMMPFQAISDAEAALIEQAARNKRAAEAAAAAVEPEPARGRNRALLISVFAVALLAFATVVGIKMRASGNAPPDAALAASSDAAQPPGRDAGVADAAAMDAASPAADASPPIDAPPRRRRADARTPRSRADARTKQVGTGSLKVGASPRGDVYVDGKLIGEAPGKWSLPAGKHRVDVKYKGQTETFHITVRADKTTSLGLIEFRR